MNGLNRTVVCGCAAWFYLAFSQALAADSTDDAGAALEQVIVTALKRESPAQSTAVSVSTFDAARIEASGLASLADVSQFTPNANFSQSAVEMGSPLAAALFIRGIGQLDFPPTTEAGVGLYVDNVYIARAPGAVLDLADVRQIEVLKGPQGTLFGKNTIGGVVNITTQSPDFSASEATAKLTVGERHRVNVDATLNAPIADGIAGRVSFGYRSRDGFVARPNGNGPTGADDGYVPRGKLRISAGDATDILVAADYRHMSAAATAISIKEFDANAGLIPAYNALVGLPGGKPITSVNTLSPNDRTDLSSGYDHTDFSGGGASFHIEHRFDDALLRSVSAYRSLYSRNRRDSDGSVVDLNYDDYRDRQHQWSEELDLFGKSFGDRLSWTLGAFYFQETGDSRYDISFVPGLFEALEVLPGAVVPLGDYACPVGPACAGGAGNPLNVLFDLDLTDALHVHSHSSALFADAEWAFTPRVAAFGGLRYTSDSKRVSVSILRNVSGAYYTPPTSPPEKTWSKFSPRAGIKWQITPDTLLYGTIAQGFKAGGFNPRPGSQSAASTPFDPEQLWAYEVGSKNEFLRQRLRVNAAVFYYDYSDMQILAAEVLPGDVLTTEVIDNVGRARLYGADISAAAAVTERFNLQAAIGFLRAYYRDSAFAITGIEQDTPLPKAPKWTGSVAAEYRLNIKGHDVMLRADYGFTSANYPDARATPVLKQKAHGVMNARIAWASRDERWNLALYGNNAFDTRYVQNGFDARDSQGSVTAVPNDPREIGVQVGARF